MTRRTAIPALLLAAAFAGAIACLDSSGPVSRGPVNPLDTLPGLLVSRPVDAPSTAGSVTASGAGASAAEHVVYVSMVPGTVPTGLQATIRDQTTGASVTTAIVGGGFDPVPIAAEVGDTLQVEITRMGTGPLKASDLVKPIRPPTVVRTSPPKGGHDVPLNAVIVVVFSEPIDSLMLTTGSVQLWRDSVQVGGTVRFADAAHLRAEFHPDSLLAPQTAYRLVATQEIRDASGTPLDSALDVPFTTGTAIAPPASPIIAFHSNHGIEEIGADGLGRAVLIADSTAFQPAWSPDGVRLAFTRFADGGNACEIYTVRADGSDERKITTPDTAAIRAGLPTWCASFPAWSPDGAKIAFAAGPRGCAEAPYCWSSPGFIYVVNTDGSNERQLFTLGSLPPPQYSNFHYVSLTTPMWSPDGSMIAFTGDGTNGGDDLWWAYIGAAAGSGASRLTDAGLEGPTWSPDGSQIAGGGWVGITLLNPDGSIAAVLTQFGWDVDPAWSPDGAHLVFTRWGTDSTGNASVSDLFIINRDGTGLRQLTTTGDASHPVWRGRP